MSANDLPGHEQALKDGYELTAYSANGQSATYSKSFLALKVFSDGTAELWSQIGLAKIVIEKFQYPHPKLESFEKQIATIYHSYGDAGL